MSDRFRMWVYTRKGDLWEVFQAPETELRQQGEAITKVKGQLAWHCSLRKNGVKVAECRRGVWKKVQP